MEERYLDRCFGHCCVGVVLIVLLVWAEKTPKESLFSDQHWDGYG